MPLSPQLQSHCTVTAWTTVSLSSRTIARPSPRRAVTPSRSALPTPLSLGRSSYFHSQLLKLHSRRTHRGRTEAIPLKFPHAPSTPPNNKKYLVVIIPTQQLDFLKNSGWHLAGGKIPSAVLVAIFSVSSEEILSKSVQKWNQKKVSFVINSCGRKTGVCLCSQ